MNLSLIQMKNIQMRLTRILMVKNLLVFLHSWTDHILAEEYYKNDYPDEDDSSGKSFDKDIVKLTFNSLLR